MLNIFKIQLQVTGPVLPSRSLQICHSQQYNNHVVNYTKCIHVVATLWCHFLRINVQFYCQRTFLRLQTNLSKTALVWAFLPEIIL